MASFVQKQTTLDIMMGNKNVQKQDIARNDQELKTTLTGFKNLENSTAPYELYLQELKNPTRKVGNLGTNLIPRECNHQSSQKLVLSTHCNGNKMFTNKQSTLIVISQEILNQMYNTPLSDKINI